MMINSR